MRVFSVSEGLLIIVSNDTFIHLPLNISLKAVFLNIFY